MSRPKLSDAQRRAINFTVRLTEGELKKLEQLAELCGKPPGILMRDKVFKGKFPQPKMAKLDFDTYLELKKIGVNLNQLTRQVNSGVVPTALLGFITRLLKQQETIIKLLTYDRKPENR
ncbi:MAG TPA: plasmid mobilization relaxosome protein MobC [Mucilaginibacter sp.]|jgi:hypothetical protein